MPDHMNASIASQLCSFVSSGPGVVRCTKCGKTLASDRPASQVKAGCRKSVTKPTKAPTPLPAATQPAAPAKFRETSPEALPCVHRGGVVRQEQCRRESCLGNGVWFPVLSCAQFGECSIDHRAVKGLHVCKSCKARTPPGGELVTPTVTQRPVRTTPIRVAFLTPTMGLGGAERWIVSLCRAWADRTRVDVQAVALTAGAQTWEPFCVDLESMSVPVLGSRLLHADGPNAERAIARLPEAADALRAATQGVDVLIHWGVPFVADLIRLAGYRGPSVSVSHGSGQWTLDMTTQAASGSTHFAAVSIPSMKAQPEHVQDRTEILWNGVDLERVKVLASRASMRTAWNLDDDDIAIGYVGRLSDEKNPMAIADAWRGLGGTLNGRRVVPVWIGDGWQAAKYHALIRETVGDAGRIVPATNDVGSVLNALDVYCLASPGEGFSLGLMEAWAAGRPAVSTPVGAVPELEQRFGAMVCPVPVSPSPDELARAVEQAVSADGAEIARNAQRVTLEHLTLAAMGERWATHLDRIAR